MADTEMNETDRQAAQTLADLARESAAAPERVWVCKKDSIARVDIQSPEPYDVEYVRARESARDAEQGDLISREAAVGVVENIQMVVPSKVVASLINNLCDQIADELRALPAAPQVDAQGAAEKIIDAINSEASGELRAPFSNRAVRQVAAIIIDHCGQVDAEHERLKEAVLDGAKKWVGFWKGSYEFFSDTALSNLVEDLLTFEGEQR